MAAFRNMLNAKYPIMQAPMAGVTSPSLVSTVCNNGCIGSHGCAMLTPDQILNDIKQIKTNIQNNSMFNINLFPLKPSPTNQTNPDLLTHLKPIHNILNKYYNQLNITQPNIEEYTSYGQDFEEQFHAIITETVPIFSFTFNAISKEKVRLLKQKDTIVIGTATNTNEAKYLLEIGCNAIIAQGSEAGAHRGTFLGSFNDSMIGVMTLIPSIINAIDNKIPVIAAGGIMNGIQLNACNMLGAIGVSMGTVFLNTKECEIPECYKQILRNEKYGIDTNVCLTDKFSGRPARGLKNKFVNEMDDIVLNDRMILIPEYPIMNKLTSMMRIEAKKQQNTELMSLWCGQGVAMLREYEYNISVNELIEIIMKKSDEYCLK
eukprot:62346_1